jgi:hypothetical protein
MPVLLQSSAHFCDSLNGVVTQINNRVSWDSYRAEMSPGESIKALVVNLLVKREPFYRVKESVKPVADFSYSNMRNYQR